MNLARLLDAAATRYRDRIAITSSAGRMTYGELTSRVDALARGFASLGLTRGDRVILWLRNSPEFIETMLACWRSGLIVVPINVRLRPDEVAFHAKDSGAAAMIYSPEFAAGASAIAVDHRISTSGSTDVDYCQLLTAHLGHDRMVPCEARDDDPAWLFYTSGTTGQPKGAILSHGNLSFVVVAWCADLYCLQPEDVVLHCAPLSHGAGFHALVALARGAENVVQDRFQPTAVLAAIRDHRVTTMWLVPTQIRMLLDDPALDRSDLSSLECIVYGGSPIHVTDLTEGLERLGPVFCQLYGQGESPMTITYLRREDHCLDLADQTALTSAGFPRTGMEVRIVTEEGTEAPVDGMGEILVRGPAVMSGYWGRDKESREALSDGWLHTGDVGRIDALGRLYVLDRLKDLVITGGSNVYAREVEDALLRHHEVREAAVFGIPHRVWGESVTAVVVGEPTLTDEELRRWSQRELADYKRPKQIHLVPEIPKNAYGKVLKRELREQYGEHADGRAGATPTGS